MQFGKIESRLLAKSNLSLPPDKKETAAVLLQGEKTATEFFVGCAKWGRPDWVGKIYPKGTKAANFLDAYARQFNSIEFNAIYYRLPTKLQVQKWKNKTGKDFKFCPKFTDVITHVKRLKNVSAEVDKFLEVLYEFGEQLGPVFLMPHPQMGAKHLETVLQFLDALPKDIQVFTEFRHAEWFTSPHFETICNELEKRKQGIVITDSAGRRDCVHMRLTSPQAFIRFVGNSLHKSDYQRIDEWVLRLQKWMKNGLQKCYFFMHQHEELYSPELCKYLITELNRKCKTKIKVPQFVYDNRLPLE